jgi:hypothetical protein
VRSVITKTIYEIAAALQIPSLKFWPGRDPAVYVPLKSENEVLISQNPTSSNVGACNSVSVIPPMHRPPPYCVLSHPENILPVCMKMKLVSSSFFILQLLSGYRRVVKYLVNSCPCVKHDGCVTNCVNASCFLTDWSVFMLIAQSTTSCIGSSAAGIKLLIFLISTLNRTLALHRHSS